MILISQSTGRCVDINVPMRCVIFSSQHAVLPICHRVHCKIVTQELLHWGSLSAKPTLLEMRVPFGCHMTPSGAIWHRRVPFGCRMTPSGATWTRRVPFRCHTTPSGAI